MQRHNNGPQVIRLTREIRRLEQDKRWLMGWLIAVTVLLVAATGTLLAVAQAAGWM